jgi:hypothetical protein
MMRKDQKNLCEDKYHKGDYSLSQEWVDYNAVWEQHQRDCELAMEGYDERAAIHASYSACELSCDLPPPPTVTCPHQRVVEKFEYEWLKAHHPELVESHRYIPSEFECAMNKLFNFILISVCALTGIAFVCYLISSMFFRL